MNWIGMAVVAAIVAVLIILAFSAGVICGASVEREDKQKYEKEVHRLLMQTVKNNSDALESCGEALNSLLDVINSLGEEEEGDPDVDRN